MPFVNFSAFNPANLRFSNWDKKKSEKDNEWIGCSISYDYGEGVVDSCYMTTPVLNAKYGITPVKDKKTQNVVGFCLLGDVILQERPYVGPADEPEEQKQQNKAAHLQRERERILADRMFYADGEASGDFRENPEDPDNPIPVFGTWVSIRSAVANNVYANLDNNIFLDGELKNAKTAYDNAKKKGPISDEVRATIIEKIRENTREVISYPKNRAPGTAIVGGKYYKVVDVLNKDGSRKQTRFNLAVRVSQKETEATGQKYETVTREELMGKGLEYTGVLKLTGVKLTNMGITVTVQLESVNIFDMFETGSGEIDNKVIDEQYQNLAVSSRLKQNLDQLKKRREASKNGKAIQNPSEEKKSGGTTPPLQGGDLSDAQAAALLGAAATS